MLGDVNMYDLIILGSGPAGLSAAIYATRAELNTIVIEKAPMSGGQVINTYEVDNYAGFPGISGFDLSMKFREHCDKLGATFVTEITSLTVEDGIKTVTLENGDSYQAKAVIIATGAMWRKLDVPGEARLGGMGVSYCATCDGAFFRNKEVAVVGGGDVAVEDAIFLARLCKKVYVIHRRDEFRAAKILSSRLMELENVEILWDTTVEEINGTDMVESITIKNKKTEEIKNLEVAGVFVAVGMIPNSECFSGVVEMNKSGYIIADETCRTNVPGIYAAGDIRTKELRQIITAASDGANAVTSVEKYFVTI